MFEITAIIFAEFFSEWVRYRVPCLYFAVIRYILDYFCYPFIVFKIFVKRQFVINPQTDLHRYCHAHSQAADIDQRGPFVFYEIPPGDAEIVFNEVHISQLNLIDERMESTRTVL